MFALEPVDIASVETYQDFCRTKALLLEILDGLNTSIAELGISQITFENLQRARHLVYDDVFRIVFVGGFSRGKSTIVNALLGANILPSKLTPATAVITTIKYGEEPQATVCFRDANRKPEVIPIEKLRSYAVIPRGGHSEDVLGSRIDTPVEHVEVCYPLSLCRNGVEVIDSPGLEDDDTRQKITLQFLTKSDAAVVVLSSQQLLTQEEERFIGEELIARGFDHIFYVINFADELYGDEDRAEVIFRAQNTLGDSRRLFLISGRETLSAKLAGDVTHPALRAFSEFENSLERFLVNERGKHKLKSSAMLIQSIVYESKALLSVRQNLLEKSTGEDLEKLQKEFETEKKAIIKRKTRVVDEIGTTGARIGDRVILSLMRQCDKIDKDLETLGFGNKEQGIAALAKLVRRNQYKNDLLSQYHAYVMSELQNWANGEAADIVRTGLEDLMQSIDPEVEGIMKDIDSLRCLLNPEFRVSLEMKSAGLEQILASVGGFFVGGMGTAITGGILGAQDAVLQLGTVLAADVVLAIMGLLNPFTAVVTSLGAAALIVSKRGGALTEGIRIEVATKVRKAVRELLKAKDDGKPSVEDVIRQNIFKTIEGLGKAIHANVNASLRDLEMQLKNSADDIIEGKEEALSRYRCIDSKISAAEAALSRLSQLWEGAGYNGSEIVHDSE